MRIAVIGAGLTGLSLAALLRRLGVRAQVFERADGPVDGGSGIYVWPQGAQIMRFLAGDDSLLALGHGVEYFQTNNRHGEELHQTAVRLADFDFSQPAMMYVRGALLAGLRALLQTDQLSFGKTCIAIDDTGSDVMIRFADGTESRFDLVIGADGIHSAVRNSVHPGIAVVDSGVAAARGLSLSTAQCCGAICVRSLPSIPLDWSVTRFLPSVMIGTGFWHIPIITSP